MFRLRLGAMRSSRSARSGSDGGENMSSGSCSARRYVQRFAAAPLRTALVSVVLVVALAGAAAAQPKPEGEMRWALYVTVAPAWLDPGEVLGFITPFWIQ